MLAPRAPRLMTVSKMRIKTVVDSTSDMPSMAQVRVHSWDAAYRRAVGVTAVLIGIEKVRNGGQVTRIRHFALTGLDGVYWQRAEGSRVMRGDGDALQQGTIQAQTDGRARNRQPGHAIVGGVGGETAPEASDF